MANVHYLRGDSRAAWESLEASRGCADEVATPPLADSWRFVGGQVALHEGRYDLARSLLAQALNEPGQEDDSLYSGYCLMNLGVVAREQGEFAESGKLLRRSLQLATRYGDRTLSAHCLEWISGLASAHELHERALRLGGAAATVRELAGAPLSPARRQMAERWLKLSRSPLSEAAAAAAWDAGREMSAQQAIEEANLSLPRPGGTDGSSNPPRLSPRESLAAISNISWTNSVLPRATRSPRGWWLKTACPRSVTEEGWQSANPWLSQLDIGRFPMTRILRALVVSEVSRIEGTGHDAITPIRAPDSESCALAPALDCSVVLHRQPGVRHDRRNRRLGLCQRPCARSSTGSIDACRPIRGHVHYLPGLDRPRLQPGLPHLGLNGRFRVEPLRVFSGLASASKAPAGSRYAH
jgi:hypothetical protein